MSFGRDIKTERKDKKLTTTPLVQRLVLIKSQSSVIENEGVRRISETRLKKLSDALECSLIDLTWNENDSQMDKKVIIEVFY